MDPDGDNGDGLSNHALEVPQSPQVLREVDRDGGELDPVSFSGVSAKSARRVQTLHSIQKMVGRLAGSIFFFHVKMPVKLQTIYANPMPLLK